MTDNVRPAEPPADGRNLPADHLRAFVTMLVVAHHAVLAYNPYAPPPTAVFDASPWLWRAFPIVDSARWLGIELFVLINDTFFMALMFLVGGLFVRPALARRGAAGYLRERVLRLGVPFAVACVVLAPLAYWPTWLATGGEPGLAAYARAWLALPVWPAGPAWFLWLLLAFGAIAALAYRLRPAWFNGAGAAVLAGRPLTLFGALAGIGALVYVPVAQWHDATAWFAFGPFAAQTARVAWYFVWFAIGVAVGADRLFDRDGPLARQWQRWQFVAAFVFVVFLVLLITLFTQIGKGHYDAMLVFATNAAFAVSAAATSVAVMAVFARYVHGRGRVWRSLDRNAYGIYLVHYACVTWLQYALKDLPWPGAAKGTFVVIAALASSWLIAATLRRIPTIGRVV